MKHKRSSWMPYKQTKDYEERKAIAKNLKMELCDCGGLIYEIGNIKKCGDCPNNVEMNNSYCGVIFEKNGMYKKVDPESLDKDCPLEEHTESEG